MGRRKRKRLERTDELRWEQLELLCIWEEQREYERIRPLVLFGEPVPERSAETGVSERTLYRRIAGFEEVGMESLFGSKPAKRRVLPPSVRRLIVDLKAEHPALNLNGSPPDPILGPMTNVVEMDAILARDERGNPTEPDWPEADVVVGNPPFLGGRRIRGILGNDYFDALKNVYEGGIAGSPDLVCYFFERARRLIEEGRLTRAGLIATQAIRNPANRGVLENIKRSGDIFIRTPASFR
jgi:hypothetical protein